MEDVRIAPNKMRERENKNKVGKQPSAGGENLALHFQVKYFLNALSNKEPAFGHSVLQWVRELGHTPRRRTTHWVQPPLPFLKRFPQMPLNTLTFLKNGDFPKAGTQPDQPFWPPSSHPGLVAVLLRGWHWGSKSVLVGQGCQGWSIPSQQQGFPGCPN